MSKPTEYRIDHVRDLLAIPDDKLDACLADLRLWVSEMRHLDGIMESLSDMYKVNIAEITREGFIWVDDGETGCSGVELAFLDAETGERVTAPATAYATLWICGQLIGEWKPTGSAWAFQGVFSDQARAEAACRDNTYFVLPCAIDVELPHESMQAVNAYYPKGEEVGQ